MGEGRKEGSPDDFKTSGFNDWVDDDRCQIIIEEGDYIIWNLEINSIVVLRFLKDT